MPQGIGRFLVASLLALGRQVSLAYAFPDGMASSARASFPGSCAESDADRFFRLLFHDDRDSFYVVSRRARSGAWTEMALRAGEVSNLSFDAHADWYVTRNGFAGRRRRVEECRQVNALMFDIDCHDGGHEVAVPRALDALCGVFDAGVLPVPTMLVHTGRGLHLYYVLERSTPARLKSGARNERGLAYVNDVTAGISRVLSRVLANVAGVEVDECVYDLARVSRIPGTVNQNSHTTCEIVMSSEHLFTLAELSAAGEKPAPQVKQGRSGGVVRFDRMLLSRLRKVRELRDLRGAACVGHRDMMLFVYYNTATQIYGPAEALRLAREYNAGFCAPLPDKDVEQIARTVDANVVRMGRHAGEKGFYPLSAATLVEKLALTADEAEALEFFASRRKEQREAAKQATRQRRIERNERIRTLYATGSMTQAQVAEVVGCSLRTVSAVLNADKLERAAGNTTEQRPEQAEEAKTQASESPTAEVAADEASPVAEEQSSQTYAKKCPTSCCGGAPQGSGLRSPALEVLIRLAFDACRPSSLPSFADVG